MAVLEVILLAVLAVVCLAGVLITILQLPGTWLILIAAAAYAWHGAWKEVTLMTICILGGIALVAEGGETLCSFWLAKKGGASRRAAWYGLVGGIAGALLLTVPVPVVGTLLGAALGCFAGATLGELQSGKNPVTGARVGVYAAVGRVLGTTFKLAAALAMASLTMLTALTDF